jgi:hypothetical protein
MSVFTPHNEEKDVERKRLNSQDKNFDGVGISRGRGLLPIVAADAALIHSLSTLRSAE